MERDKRYQHAQYLIGFMNNYSLVNPDSQEVTICCRENVKIRTYLITLVSVSDFVRKILSESSNYFDEEVSLIVPDLDPDHLETFFR
jgi:hypothetical protein